MAWTLDCEDSVSIRYIGSKARVAEAILDNVGSPTAVDGVFVDAFSGTGAVARAAAEAGWSVRINDSLLAATVLSAARLVSQGAVGFAALGGYRSAIESLNDASPLEGFVWRTYSPASQDNEADGVARQYFTQENAAKIDGARALVSSWSGDGWLSSAEECLLLGDLLLAANHVANTAGTYGCYLRNWSPSAIKPLRLKARDLLQVGVPFEWHTTDVTNVPSSADDILYLDPPYTKRQYAAYYHVLESIVRADEPRVSGITGLREWQPLASDFCYKRRALDALLDLIGSAVAQRIYLSYSSEGHVDLGELVDGLSRIGDVGVTWLADIGRYRPNNAAARAGSKVSEYLLFVDKSTGNRGQPSVNN